MTVTSWSWSTGRQEKSVYTKIKIAHSTAWGKRSVFLCPSKTLQNHETQTTVWWGRNSCFRTTKKKKYSIDISSSHTRTFEIYTHLTVSLTNPVPHSYCGRTCNKCPTADPRRDPMNRGILFGSCFILFSSHVWCIIFTKLLEQETACKHCSTDRRLVAECCS